MHGGPRCHARTEVGGGRCSRPNEAWLPTILSGFHWPRACLRSEYRSAALYGSGGACRRSALRVTCDRLRAIASALSVERRCSLRECPLTNSQQPIAIGWAQSRGPGQHRLGDVRDVVPPVWFGFVQRRANLDRRDHHNGASHERVVEWVIGRGRCRPHRERGRSCRACVPGRSRRHRGCRRCAVKSAGPE
ncbi:MAG: hypothetical protein JWN99_3352 [Ilumatobacteraceae bacterium]|nr:hypothetical protein [Ilumatobacteraceae bacterium]